MTVFFVYDVAMYTAFIHGSMANVGYLLHTLYALPMLTRASPNMLRARRLPHTERKRPKRRTKVAARLLLEPDTSLREILLHLLLVRDLLGQC